MAKAEASGVPVFPVREPRGKVHPVLDAPANLVVVDNRGRQAAARRDSRARAGIRGCRGLVRRDARVRAGSRADPVTVDIAAGRSDFVS